MSIALSRAATAAPRRPRRAFVALGVVAALAGGGLVAGATEASAAPVHTASKATPKTSFAVSKHSISPSSARPVYRVKAAHAGHAVSGKVKLIVNGKVRATKGLHHGKTSFKPSIHAYRTGKNYVHAVVDPRSPGLTKRATATAGVHATRMSRGAKIVNEAKKHVGARYVYGASGPRSFDCSGLTRYVYKKAVGKSLPHSSSAQRSAGHKVSRSNAKPGDLIWTPGHVAVYAGGGKQVEAARPGVGVVKRHIWQSNPTFVRI